MLLEATTVLIDMKKLDLAKPVLTNWWAKTNRQKVNASSIQTRISCIYVCFLLAIFCGWVSHMMGTEWIYFTTYYYVFLIFYSYQTKLESTPSYLLLKWSISVKCYKRSRDNNLRLRCWKERKKKKNNSWVVPGKRLKKNRGYCL